MKPQEGAYGGLPPVGAMKPIRPKSDATTWVSRDQNGQMVRVKVVDMEDSHLFRWIRYFRKKYRDEGFQGSDAALDTMIRASIVTAPAIFAEAQKRGVYQPPPPDKAGPRPVLESVDNAAPRERALWERKIELEDEE